MKYYSNGKLLLTGEYLVLHGAKALAFPVKYGQSLELTSNNNTKGLSWCAIEPSGIWFEAKLSLPGLNIESSSSSERAEYLKNLLLATRRLNPGFLIQERGLQVETKTNFPIKWGLGTSSTLINNIAQWAGADPFKLNKTISKGSGYDIACAGSNSPITYQKIPSERYLIKRESLEMAFQNQLYFVYSGRKKSTEKHISKFIAKDNLYNKEIQQINRITENILSEKTLDGFMSLLSEHEKIIGKVIGWEVVLKKSFPDFKGMVKSLGAWGGDFMLAATHENSEYVQQYFEQFGLSTIIPFNKMIIE